jgi:DNA-binding CsgD family transcriptional regulator
MPAIEEANGGQDRRWPLGRSWPLVGRAAELDAILRALASESTGGVVLAGPAGVGKTRLARAVRDHAREAGLPTEEVMATAAAASIPLGAFAHVLPDGDAGAALVDMLGRAASWLAARGEGQRVVLTVDDAHLLDDASAALVHRLARTREVFVVVTVRVREKAPDAIVALWKDQLAERLDIGPLAEADLADLVRSVVGGEPDGALVPRLFALSQGNALFTRELLVSGLESGSLQEAAGRWAWHGPIGGASRLQELVEARLERLAPELRAALEVTAFGEPVGVSLLEGAVGIAAVDALERLELLAVHRDEKREYVHVVHPLYAEVLRASTSRRRAAAIRRALAEAVEATGARRRDDILRVALWRLEAGGTLDAEKLAMAAAHADAVFDHPLAERFARAAIDAGAGPGARLTLGRALWQQGRAGEADQVWSALLADVGTDEDRVEVATYRAINLFYRLGQLEEAEEVLAATEKTVGPKATRLPFLVQRSEFALFGGDVEAAVRAARRVVTDPDASPRQLVQATVVLGPALAVLGRTTEAVTAVDRALPLALEVETFSAVELAGQLLVGRVAALIFAGRYAEADELAQTTYELAKQHHSHDGVATFAWLLGQVALMTGRPRTAQARLREGAALMRDHDRSNFLPWCLGGLAAASALVGDVDEAGRALDEAGASVGRQRLFEMELVLGRCWTSAARGHVAEAARMAIEEGAAAAADGQAGLAGLAFHAAVRFGEAVAVAPRLQRLAEASESEFVQAAARHAAASATDDGLGLEAVAADFERLGARLVAAEVLVEAASVHRRLGEGAVAAKLAERARCLLDGCEGARTPALTMLDDAVSLTRREREVALLAADGLASREIADRLYLSVRTVDNHLHRAYYKLGVSSRSDLGAALGRTE